MTTAPHPLACDPLAFLAFEKFRRVGAAIADGKTITHDGNQHRLTVHTICTVKTVHVVIEPVAGLETGQKRAMAIISIEENGYASGPGGLDLVLPALYEGTHVHGSPSSACDYRVLTHLPVPPAFQDDGHD